MTTFENPWKSLNVKDPEKAVRLQTFIPREEHNFLFRDLHPGHGSVATVMNILILKFIEGLRSAGITDHATHRMEFEKFLVEGTFGSASAPLPQPKKKVKKL